MDIQALRSLTEEFLSGTDMFLVDITATANNEIEIILDSETFVSVESCTELNRRITAAFDRDVEDFALTVCSAGIGEPLKDIRQYRKLIGQSVEVLLKSGIKILAHLDEAEEDGITLSYDEKVSVEGKKRKELVHTVRKYAFDEIKQTVEYLDFK